MPRHPRLDAPGLLHHVIARGIERREIFQDDRDRGRFVERLGELVLASGARLYTWCLLSNHFHLVLRSGERPLAWFMRRLMTGHAIRYNLRKGRSGHLFQNRYKNVIVEEEPHFLELVRYVALNPVRAGMVHSAEELDGYFWSGHAVLVGSRREAWQDTEAVLGRFGAREREAVGRYRDFVLAGWDQGRREEFAGGGLIRSAGGVDDLVRRSRPEDREASDERILGSGAFVEAVWRATEQAAPKGSETWEKILQEVASAFGVERPRLLGRSRERQVSRARKVLLFRGAEEAGLSASELARRCGLNPSSVIRAIELAREQRRAEAVGAAPENA